MHWAVWMEANAPHQVVKALQSYHDAYIHEKKNQGKVVSGGTFVDLSGGLFIFDTQTFQEAEKLAEEDPLVAQNACSYTIKPWQQLT